MHISLLPPSPMIGATSLTRMPWRMARTTWPQARAFSSTALRRRIEENISSARLEELLQSQGDKPLLVDFFAEWCGPCKMLSPVLHKLVNTPSMVGGKEVDLVTIDVDNNMEAAQKYGVCT